MSVSSRSAARQEKNVHDSQSKTDWERVKSDIAANAPIPYDSQNSDDGPYDPNDDKAVDAYWDKAKAEGRITRGPGKRGPQRAPTKELVSLRLSKDVLNHFRATGPGWQTRIEEVLKHAVKK